jgi:hypothetical protein
MPRHSNDKGADPDMVMGCAGDVPTLERLAAVDLLRRHLPELKIRVINVVDLMRLQDKESLPMDSRIETSTRCSPPTNRSCLRITAILGSFIASPTDALIMTISTFADTRHDHHTVRYGRPQRHGPVSSGDGGHQQVPKLGYLARMPSRLCGTSSSNTRNTLNGTAIIRRNP